MTLLPPDPERTVFPLSFTQSAVWLRQQATPTGTAQVRAYAFRLQGRLDVAALRRALAAVTARHAALRTTFPLQDGVPVQVVQAHLVPPVTLDDATRWSQEDRDAHLADEAAYPFDLEHGPLLRLHLWRCAPQDYTVLLLLHDLIADARAVDVVLPALAAGYTAETSSTPVLLESPALAYAEYAHAQDAWIAGPGGDLLWAYWRRTLDGVSPVLTLPSSLPHPRVPTEEGAVVVHMLDMALSARLEALAEEAGVALAVVLLTAFSTLLLRYTGQEDLVVGISLPGTREEGDVDLVGCRVEALPLRLDLSGEPSFIAALHRVGASVVEARAHAGFPFVRLVERLGPARAPGQTPLVQVYYEAYDAPRSLRSDLAPLHLGQAGPPLHFADLELEPLALERRAAREDLTLRTACIEGKVVLSFAYKTAVFAPDDVARLAGHLATMLRGAADDSAQLLATLPLVTPAEREQLLTTWNGALAGRPVDRCMHEVFEEVLRRTPERVVIEYGAEHVTCRDFDARANRLAHYLQGRGEGPEVVVGLCLSDPLFLSVAKFAVRKAGRVLVLLDPTLPRERLSFMATDAGVVLLVTERRWEDLLSAVCPGPVVSMDGDADEIAREADTALDAPVRPDNTAALAYTSGSTGLPKGVVHSHAPLYVEDARATVPTARRAGIDTGFSFTLTLTVGGTLVFSRDDPRRDPVQLLRFLCTEHITAVMLPGVMIQQVAERALHEDVFPTDLREVRTIGEQLRITDEIRQFFAHLPDCTLRNLYGSTESSTVLGYTLEGPAHTWPPLPPAGHVLPHAQVYLLDAHRQIVPVGVEGEIYVGGSTLARGYLHRPELTAERFVPHPFSADPDAHLFRTGDRARRRADGVIQMVGRDDHQVKIRAFRVELGEVEAVLQVHPGVAAAVVLAREDAPGGMRLVAYIVPRPGSAPGPSALHAFMAARLPAYMTPAAYVLLDRLPRLPNAKVDRRALPPPPPLRPDLDTPFVAPRTPLEETLTALWAQVLGVEQVGVDDDFFALGGHSLLVMQMSARVHATLGVDVLLRGVFETPTVAALAVALTDAAPAADRITAGTDSASIRARVDALSEAEIDALLAVLDEDEEDGPR